MHSKQTAAAIVLPLVLSATSLAQSTWDKSYTVSGKAALAVDVDDASVRVASCGSCRTVHIHVDGKGNDLSKFHIADTQGGNGIHFTLKRPESRSFLSFGWNHHSPEVVIQMPAETQLSAHSGDGSLTAAGLRGGAEMHTGDGSVQLTEVSGALRVTTGDGSLQIHRAEGTLVASTGDGSMDISGRFSRVETHSGSGSIHLSLLPGSQLTASSRITTGDGSIVLDLPRDLRAEVQVTSGDGTIANALPLALSTEASRHGLHGTMNGGGAMLVLQSGDGSIAMTAH